MDSLSDFWEFNLRNEYKLDKGLNKFLSAIYLIILRFRRLVENGYIYAYNFNEIMIMKNIDHYFSHEIFAMITRIFSNLWIRNFITKNH